LFKILFTEKAMEFLNKLKQKRSETGENEKYVIAIFEYSKEGWSVFFCGNIVEVVKEIKVLYDTDFIVWEDINEEFTYDVYIEEKIIDQYESKEFMLIDVIIFEEYRGMLFIKSS